MYTDFTLRIVVIDSVTFECSGCRQKFRIVGETGDLIARFFQHVEETHPTHVKET